MRDKVIIESPYAATPHYTVEENVEFARRICARALREGFNPFASHLFYPQFLNDDDTDERVLGIKSGVEWGVHAQRVWFCIRPKEKPSRGMSWAYTQYRKLEKHLVVQLCHPDGDLIKVIEEFDIRETESL